MSLTVQDVCNTIEQWAPPGLAYEWDHAGLCIGAPKAPVSRALVCLTVTRAAFDAARKARAQMIVAHHPLIWSPLKTLRTDDVHTRLCLDIATARMACYAAHTNLDLAPNGVNHILAQQLGLQDTKPLIPARHAAQVKLVTFVPESHLTHVHDAVAEAGAGIIGEYTHCSFSTDGAGTFMPSGKANPFSGRKGQINKEPERRFETLVTKARLPRVLDALLRAHPYEEVAYDVVMLENVDARIGLGVQGMLAKPQGLRSFANHVKKALRLRHVRVVGPAGTRVRHIGVLGGAGGSEVHAVPPGIDVLVTGDVKYHDALTALDRGLTLIDAGHAGTEKGIVPEIARYLRGQCRGLKVSTYAEPEIFSAL